MPSLKVAWVRAMNSRSSIPSRWLKLRMWGMVASPTPTVPISSDSMRRRPKRPRKAQERAAAVIQPAVPPPTMTTVRIGPCFDIDLECRPQDQRDTAVLDEEGARRAQQLIVQDLARPGDVVEQVRSLYSDLDLRGQVVKEGGAQGAGVLVHDRGEWDDDISCGQQEGRAPAPRQARVPRTLVVEQGGVVGLLGQTLQRQQTDIDVRRPAGADVRISRR